MKKIKKLIAVILIAITLLTLSVPAFASEQIDSKIISALSDYYTSIGSEDDVWFINAVLPVEFDNYKVVVSAYDGRLEVVTEKIYGQYIFEMPSAFAPSATGLLLVNSDNGEVKTFEEAYESGIVDLDTLYTCYKNNSKNFLCTIRENKADFSELKYLVDSYDRGYYFEVGNIYSKESIQRREAAYENAKNVLADESLSQDVVDEAYNRLETALYSMEIIGGCCAPYLLGDANKDDIIDVNDVTKVQIFLAKIEDVTQNNNYMYSDVNQDRYVDVTDVTEIQLYLAGYERECRINQYTIEHYFLIETN